MTKDISCVPFFEANRVLTANRLNQIVDFSLFHIRQNRVLLHGIGILCGFEVRFEEGCIIISEGVGITSCGDLIKSEECKLCTTVSLTLTKEDFVRDCPGEGYSNTITVCELKEGDPADPNIDPDWLENTVVVLLLQRCFDESAAGCISDCDDSGLDQCFKLRKLLVKKEDLVIPANGDTSGPVGKKLPLPSIKRLWYVAGEIPDTGNIIIAAADFYPSYARNIGRGLGPADPTNIIAGIRDAYICAYEVYRTALGLELEVDLASCFRVIQAIADQFPISPLPSLPPYPILRHYQVQYFYDYLKDLIYAYEEFVDAACEAVGDLEICPDPCQFPAFLILGNYDGTDLTCRNFFQKTCQVTCDYHTGQKARFLFNRMIKLLKAFFLLDGNRAQIYNQAQITNDLTISLEFVNRSPIRITPSRNHNQSLSDKAIPYYLAPSFQIPIPGSEPEQVVLKDCWNYKKTLKCQQEHIPAYHNADWQLSLLCNIDTYDFYRIEGLVGHRLGYAVGVVEQLRNTYNLGFDIKCVQLDGSLETVILDHKEVEYGDLELAYCTAYEDLICKLCEVINAVPQSPGNEIQIATKLKNNIPSTLPELDFNNKNPREELSLHLRRLLFLFKFCYIDQELEEIDTLINDAIMAAVPDIEDLKNLLLSSLGQEPYDADIICCFLMLVKIHELLLQRLEDFQHSYLLNNFASKHPGMEHLAGVYRGGTFIITYDIFPNDTASPCLPVVVADFCLPYYCCGSSTASSGQLPAGEASKPSVFMVNKVCYIGEKSPKCKIGVYPQGGQLSIADLEGVAYDFNTLLEQEDGNYILCPDRLATAAPDTLAAIFGPDDQVDLQLKYIAPNGQSCDYLIQLCRLTAEFEQDRGVFTSIQLKRAGLTARWELMRDKEGTINDGYDLICVKEEEVTETPDPAEKFQFVIDPDTANEQDKLILTIWDNKGCKTRSDQLVTIQRRGIPDSPAIAIAAPSPQIPTKVQEQKGKKREEEDKSNPPAEKTSSKLASPEEIATTRLKRYQTSLTNFTTDKRYSRYKSLQQALALMEDRQLSVEKLTEQFSKISTVFINTAKKKEDQQDLIQMIYSLTHFYLDSIIQIEPKVALEEVEVALLKVKGQWQAAGIDHKALIKAWKATELEQSRQAPAIKSYLKTLRKDG